MKKTDVYIIFIIKLIFCNECDINTPILINDECQSSYCIEEQFENGFCKINNEIIKTQWLTNIIWIGEENSRFINFANFSNGTMIIEVSSDSISNKRIFFGLQPNGSYLFGKENIHQFTMTASNSNNKRHYPENLCVTIKEDSLSKEYIVSIANEEQYIELYDFDNDYIYEIKSKDRFGNQILSIRNSGYNILYNNEEYIIFVSWIDNLDTNSFITKAIKFESKNIEQANNINVVIEHPYESNREKSAMTSCFVSESNIIWVMGFIQENIGNNTYYIILYNPENIRNELFRYHFDTVPYYYRTFFKMVHLKGDIGVVFFFAYEDGTSYPYPFFMIKEYKNNELVNYINEIEKYQINISSRLFHYDCLLNDLIRVSDYKVAFSTMDMNKTKCFIIIFEIHNTSLLYMNLYEIDLYALYNIKFFLDIKEHLFEQHLAFGFNFCNSENCEQSTDTHYTAFMIFSYPNSTDGYLNINQYLVENKGKTIDDISINLTNNIKIENNIFGYIFSSINIVNLIGCDGIVLKSGSDNVIISNNYNLSENENIKFFISNEKETFNCLIYFRYIVTEPDYLDHKKYYVDIIPIGIEYEDSYNSHKKEYLGKISDRSVLQSKDWMESFVHDMGWTTFDEMNADRQTLKLSYDKLMENRTLLADRINYLSTLLDKYDEYKPYIKNHKEQWAVTGWARKKYEREHIAELGYYDVYRGELKSMIKEPEMIENKGLK